MVGGWNLRKFKSGDQYIFTEIGKKHPLYVVNKKIEEVIKARMATPIGT